MGNNYSSVQDLEERNLSAMSVANWGQKWVDFSFEGQFLFSGPSTKKKITEKKREGLDFNFLTYLNV